MRPGNYRINPTLNGPMHLGHLGLARLNRSIAHAEGGQFIFRGEDNQTAWQDHFPQEKARQIGAQWLDDLRWLGLEPDLVYYESEREGVIAEIIHAHFPGLMDTGVMPYVPQLIGSGISYYPYALYLTSKSVLMDNMDGIGTVLVGEDLLSRFSLYIHLCGLFGIIDPPGYICIPRLRSFGASSDHLSQVSKTNGALSLVAIRERGYSPDQVLAAVNEAFLKNPQAEWSLDNLRSSPSIPHGLFT